MRIIPNAFRLLSLSDHPLRDSRLRLRGRPVDHPRDRRRRPPPPPQPGRGGVARPLTSKVGEVSRPLLSPDGTQHAFVGREEGQSEIYLMPAVGGQARRLTFMGGTLCLTAGWTRDGKIVFANNAAQPLDRKS